MEIPDVYQQIFTLKNQERIQELLDLAPTLVHSELLLHQLMYALGQLPVQYYDTLRPFLISYIKDQKQFPVVRHEAAEALANYMRQDDIPVFQCYLHSPVEQLRDTCRVAVDKVKAQCLNKHYGTQFAGTREPAAPFDIDSVKQELKGRTIEEYLLDSQVDMFKRYRMMYFCRDKRDKNCIRALANLLRKENRACSSALLRHEVCFIFGQTGEITSLADPQIRMTVLDEEESPIVRHEALNAMGTYSKDRELMRGLLRSESRIVRETAELALQQVDYWES